MMMETTKLFNSGKAEYTAFKTDKGYEVWSYAPAYDWDGNTYHTTVTTLEEAKSFAWDHSGFCRKRQFG